MEDIYTKQLGKMKRPIPGQSLTNDPQNPAPFEGPPEHTNKRTALEEIFGQLIDESNYETVIEGLASGTPVVNMTQVILYEGFRQGKWNPDLFLLLIEPTMYMIMALAERVGVEYVIDYDSEEEDPKMKELANKFEKVKGKVGSGKIGPLPPEIEKKIAELPVDSLLAKKAPVKGEEEVVESIMTRPR